MLGYNLVTLGLIFIVFSLLMPFSFLFNGEILVLAYSDFTGANIVLL